MSRSVSIEKLQQLRRQDSEFKSSEGSAFEVATKAFSSLADKLEGEVVAAMLESFRAGCRKYRKEK